MHFKDIFSKKKNLAAPFFANANLHILRKKKLQFWTYKTHKSLFLTQNEFYKYECIKQTEKRIQQLIIRTIMTEDRKP